MGSASAPLVLNGTMSHPLIALLDIGKTNAKLSVVDPISGAELRGSRRANAVRGPSIRSGPSDA